MSKSVADTEPFPFRQELQETIFEAIRGWDVRLPGKPLRRTTGVDAEAIAQAIREVYVDGLRNSGSAGQHYLAMRGEVVQAHNELDRVSIERSEDGAIHSLPHRVAILVGRYLDEQRRRIDCEHAPVEEAPDGWQGQLPAEGTRRRLVFEAIMRDRVFRTVGAPAATAALRLADAIEEALQHPSEPSDEYREDDRPKSLFTAGVEIEPNETSTLGLDEGTVGVVRGKRFCSRCGQWHYDVDFGEFGAVMLEPNMRHARDEEEFKAGVELSRGLAHFRNVIRHMLGL